jgi:hypothetical protein
MGEWWYSSKNYLHRHMIEAVVSFTSRPLYHPKSVPPPPRNPFICNKGDPRGRSGQCGEKNPLHLPGIDVLIPHASFPYPNHCADNWSRARWLVEILVFVLWIFVSALNRVNVLIMSAVSDKQQLSCPCSVLGHCDILCSVISRKLN